MVKCARCGGDVFEVSLVPRDMQVASIEDGVVVDYEEAGDKAHWEAETVIGYGCGTDDCANSKLDVGNLHLSDDGSFYSTGVGPTLGDMAEAEEVAP